MRPSIKRLIIAFSAVILVIAPLTMDAQIPLKREQNGGKKKKKGNGNNQGDKTTPTEPKVTVGTLSFGYATWNGGIRNGKPDGKGKLTFSETHAVDRHSNVQANPGDYFEANYDNGSLISGKLYDQNGNLLKTIIP